MKKNLYRMLAGILTCTSLTGCLPEDNLQYDGPSLVEFKNHTQGMVQAALTPRGVVTDDASLTQTASSRGIFLNSGVVDTIYVQLVGAHSPTNLDVSFTVSPESSAVEGQHYIFRPAGTRTVTIPANSSVGYILTEPIADSFGPEGQIRFIDFTLNANQNPAPSINYARFRLSFKR